MNQFLKIYIGLSIALGLGLITTTSIAQSFYANASYSICFTPGSDCTNDIVDTLNQAKRTILVQAYSFTSAPIAKALVDAKKRGVDVKVILDKSQVKSEKYSSSTYLNNAGIPVWIDFRPAIAHNKIMIIDNETVITGSFNFTKAAQQKNAENLLIIQDNTLAQRYIDNWIKRQNVSSPLNNYYPVTKSKDNKGSYNHSNDE